MRKFLLTLVVPALFAVAANAQVNPGLNCDTPKPTNNNLVQPWTYNPDNIRLGWDTSPFKPFIINGLPFRLLYPQGFDSATVAPNSYPLTIMMHGIGEAGEHSNCDNNYQLRYGAREHLSARNSGRYTGFVMAYQSPTEFLSQVHEPNLIRFIEQAVQNLGVDPNRVAVHGLSGGGSIVWRMASNYPTHIAAAIPMSAAITGYTTDSYIDNIKFKAVWQAQGGLDKRPSPSVGNSVANAFKAKGANHTYAYYPDLGHGTWGRMYNESDFFPFLQRANVLNIHPLYFKSNFCSGEAVQGTLGIQSGFAAYEWQRNGVTISGATSNQYQYNQLGTYRVRVKRSASGAWSYWSEPLEVQFVGPSPTPELVADGPTALPTLDGRTSVIIKPKTNTYNTYTWSNGSNKEFLEVTSAGSYSLVGTVRNGCPSATSNTIKVTYGVDNALNGPGLPQIDIAGQTELVLRWADNSNNETGFEIYSGPTGTGPWTLTAQLPANTTVFNHTDLQPDTRYYYKIRAVNQNGGSPYSSGSERTLADELAPSTPQTLTTLGATRDKIVLQWGQSTDNSDNFGTIQYEVWANNSLLATTTDTLFTLNSDHGLVARQNYTISVRAKDRGNNYSPFSNQASASTFAQGLIYYYYKHDNLSQVAEIESLNPSRISTIPTFDISVRDTDDRFAFKYEGWINIPTNDTYKFFTNSDDGSKLYIDDVEVVNNDGTHGPREVGGNVPNLTAGMHKIKVLYFENGSGQTLDVRWSSSTKAKELIPAAALTESYSVPARPTSPANLTATAQAFNSVRLTWTDRSTNETGFEIFRSTSNAGPFTIVATTGANATSYTDQNNVQPLTKYFYKIKAIGQGGESDFAGAEFQALNYEYYTGNYSNLNGIIAGTVTPTSTGRIHNFSLSPRTTNSNFAFKYSGKIWISTAGSYTFYTTSDDGSVLYINNNQVVANDFNQGMTERNGSVSLSQGFHDIMVAYRQGSGGFGLEVRYSGPNLAKQLIPDHVIGQEWPNATTPATPPGPNAPTNLAATISGANSIQLNWTDNATNETGFEIFRNNILYKTFNQANVSSFRDDNILANTTYTYKVRGFNTFKGDFSNEITAVAGNNNPVLAATGNISARYGATTTFELRATDADGDAITFSAQGLPSFCSLVNNNDGTANLTVASTSFYDQRTYSGIVLAATDIYGGSSSETISLAVNSNWTPVISNLAEQIILENESRQMSVSATDANNDAMTISLETGTPSFISAQAVRNGMSILTISPNYGHAGKYQVTVKVTDSKGGVTRKTFPLTVTKVSTTKVIKVNMNQSFHLQAPSPWINFAQYPSAGKSVANLRATDGTITNTTITLLSTFGQDNKGPMTGNDSGKYPDPVLNTYFSGHSDGNTRSIRISGLNPDLTYALELMGSTTNANPGVTSYTVNGVTKTLEVLNNTSNVVRFTSLRPPANGEIILQIRRTGNTGQSYLNSMIIESMYDDGSIPLAATDLVATLGSGGGVSLSWTDNSFNEVAYELQRSANGGTFTTIAELGAETEAYFDATGVGRQSYAYRVRAKGNSGNSAYSNVAQINIPNRAPVVLNLPGLIGGKEETVTEFFFDIEDREGDNVTLSAANMPSFASLTKVSNTRAKITINNPGSQFRGNHTNIFITASDGDEDDVKLLTIRVTDKEKVSTLVNFNMSNEAPAPWNNMNGRIARNTFLPNLLNELNQSTGYTITNLQSWNGGEELGAETGDNSGRYIDRVMKTYFYTNNIYDRPLQLSGLKANKRYNIRFFGSSIYQSLNGSTSYNSSGQVVNLPVQSNTDNTVQINGLLADANGVIIVNVKRADGAFAYLNALEILEYDNDGKVLRPDNLKAYGTRNQKTRQHQVELSWEDNSYQETGFTIQRRVKPSGTFANLATVGTNVTSYIDATVDRATNYEYRVKANSGAGSEYSLPASARTLDYVVYINVNKSANSPANARNAPAPWNNLDKVPVNGLTWSNLKRDRESSDASNVTWVDTNIDLRLQEPWEGSNAFGPDANGAGIYDDRVIKTFYFNEIGTISITRISDLNPNQLYNIRLFAASAFGTRNGVTEYRINNKKVYLDVQNNLTNTAVIRDVKPDINGVINLEAEAGPTARYAYLSALMIEAQGNLNTNGAREAQLANAEAIVQSGADLTAYPNPTEGMLNVGFTGTVSDRAEVRIVDLTGRLVLQRSYITREGWNELKVNLKSEEIPVGVYLLRVKTSEFDSKIIRFVKQ
jgi:predicted esterase